MFQTLRLMQIPLRSALPPFVKGGIEGGFTRVGSSVCAFLQVRSLNMDAFTVLKGLVAQLDRVNVDTDQIIPKQYLKTIKRTGLREGLFSDWRYGSDGSGDRAFFLNQSRYEGATILLARDNFGCGSSREHAPWALLDYGFRCIIAPSFADIFFNNCFKNGILPVVLTEAEVDRLFYEAASFPGFKLTVNLENQTVSTADG